MRTSIIATTTAVLLSAGTAVAIGAGHAAAEDPDPNATFTVVEHAVTDATTDTGKKGDTAGDVLTFANPIFNGKDDHQIGTDNGSCVRTVKGAAYECTWTTSLDLGSITVTGPFYDTKDSVLAITGGTGKYRNVTGQMTLHARNAAGSEYDFVYEVRAPQ